VVRLRLKVPGMTCRRSVRAVERIGFPASPPGTTSGWCSGV